MFIQIHKPKSTGEIISLERRLYEVVQKEWDSQEPTGHSFAQQTQKDVSITSMLACSRRPVSKWRSKEKTKSEKKGGEPPLFLSFFFFLFFSLRFNLLPTGCSQVMWEPMAWWAILLAMPCWRDLIRPKQLSMAANLVAHFFSIIIFLGRKVLQSWTKWMEHFHHTCSPISLMLKWRVLVFARLYHCFGGRG